MTERVRLGQVGLGELGRLHALNVRSRIAAADLVRVVDARESVAKVVGEHLSVAWSTAYEDLLVDDQIDGILIVTPTATHAALIRQAALAGKHVFTEKPVSLDRASTLAAIDATQSAGVLLQVGLHRRFDPDWLAAKRLVEAGDVGEIYFFRACQRDKWTAPSVDYLPSAGGMFVDASIHDFDTARWLVGEIDEVAAIGASLSDPVFGESGDVDNAVITMRFASGALGVIDTSRVCGYGYEASLEVMGSKSTVRVAGGRLTSVDQLSSGSVCRNHVVNYQERFWRAYVEEIDAFVRAIRGGQSETTPSGHEALAAFMLSKAAEQSLAAGGPVKVCHEIQDDGAVYHLVRDTKPLGGGVGAK